MTITFSYLISRFFTSYLANERGFPSNTIASYSDGIRLLINYTCDKLEINPETINMEMLTCEHILNFLDYLENERGNSIATRNQRLAGIKTFFHFLAHTAPELMHQNEAVQAIRARKEDHAPPGSLTVTEVKAIIDAPDTTTLIGLRDKALLMTLHNTGARVQEIADLTMKDLRFDSPPTVTLTGKRRKSRTIPLWAESVELIQTYLAHREEVGIYSDHLFLNNKDDPLTRFGIGRRITTHTQTAAHNCPSLLNQHVTPHTFRHTTALHLIESGNDITIAKEWLGHADLKTTSQYIEVSIERKRAALEKIPPPSISSEPEEPQWKKADVMTFLLDLSRKGRYVDKDKTSKQSHAETPPKRNIISGVT